MSLTVDQLNALQRGTTSLRMIVKVIPRVGDVFCRALHTKKITFDGDQYLPASFTPSEFEQSSELDSSNIEINTLLSTAFNALDLRGGKWQGARVEFRVVDYKHLDYGAIFTHKGRFGVAVINGRQVSMEFRSNVSILNQPIGFTYSRVCRDVLGGIYCQRDLSDITYTGTIGTVTNNQKFIISTSKPDKTFYRGKIIFTSGANDGLEMDVQNNVGTLLTLFEPMPGDIMAGDTYSIIEGCDGTILRCDELGNTENHFAEDSIPETQKMVRVVG